MFSRRICLTRKIELVSQNRIIQNRLINKALIAKFFLQKTKIPNKKARQHICCHAL